MIKLFEEYNDIVSICDQYGIENYTINPDGSIDVNGGMNLNFNGRKLDRLPLKFGRVNGNFYCSHNKLTSLEGCPSYVGGFFDCSNNQLTSLEGCPKEVGGSFDCGNNKLTTLEGCPTELNINFYCDHNQLTSLKGGPKEVGGDFNCSLNILTSLEGCPSYVGGHFDCSYNRLTSLEGCPKNIGDFDCSYNPLPDLIIKNNKYIKDILRYQDDYSIWNIDGSLNEYRFKDMMIEIKGMKDD